MNAYIEELRECLLKVEVRDSKGMELSLESALKRAVQLIRERRKGNKIIFIGNGGSASIASHLATDFLKNANMPAIAFNDSSLITCLGNDLGYEYVFERPVRMLAGKGDILFAISSSGGSKNILNAVKEAKKKGCVIVTLSGFGRRNPLRRLGGINFYVPVDSYGYVEIIHLAICHCIADKVAKGEGLSLYG